MTLDAQLKTYAPAVLRISMALVFLWFGSQQFLHTAMWTELIPDWAVSLSHLDVVTLVHLNGAFELVFGLALLLGIYTRIASLLLGLHLLGIMFDVGYTSIGVRDFGLSFACFAIFLHGSHHWSLDAWLEKKRLAQTGGRSSM